MKMNVHKIFYPADGTIFFTGTLENDNLIPNLSTKGNWEFIVGKMIIGIVEIAYEYMPIHRNGVTLRTLVANDLEFEMAYDTALCDVILMKI
jgi:hypothetical protein